MSIEDFENWLTEFVNQENKIYVKRLSGNDTLANGAHQAGPYLPKEVFFDAFSDLIDIEKENPDYVFPALEYPSMRDLQLRAVWYNNKRRGGTRDEARLTGFGGAQSSILDPESTGAIAILVFRCVGKELDAHIWVCQNPTEEEIFQNRFEEIDPGNWEYWSQTKSDGARPSRSMSCFLSSEEILPEWFEKFPIGQELVDLAVERRPGKQMTPDKRLLSRRKCEFEAFQSIEEAVEMPVVSGGFSELSAFLEKAQSILNRRKARSGRSLEMHLATIFEEEGLVRGTSFEHDVESERGRRPDFLFPSKSDYDDVNFPSSGLRMLAVKTTCKDRWRQILNESKRIEKKHLFTLQRGISTNQFLEMQDSGVELIVPLELHKEFNKEVRPQLKSLKDFLGEIKSLAK